MTLSLCASVQAWIPIEGWLLRDPIWYACTPRIEPRSPMDERVGSVLVGLLHKNGSTRGVPPPTSREKTHAVEGNILSSAET